MRHQATVPVVVPPIKPVGLLSDNLTFTHLRPIQTGVPIRLGARVRVWGALGTVLRYLPVSGSISKEIVVRLDKNHLCPSGKGDYLVLQLQNPLASWITGVNVSVELCDFEPNIRFLKRRDHGVIVEQSATCELL